MQRGARTGWLVSLFALVLLAGCSGGPDGAAPTGPATAPSAGGPVFLPIPPSPMATPQGGAWDFARSATERISAASGGVVQVGRYKVTIPAGALASDTDITVRDPGNRYVSCELEPHGIQFLVPVELQINLHGLRYNPYTDWSVYWLAAEDQWRDQGGTFANETVRVNLWHFSTYAAGRAGW